MTQPHIPSSGLPLTVPPTPRPAETDPARHYRRGLLHGLLLGGVVAVVLAVVVVVQVVDPGKSDGGNSLPGGEQFRVDGCVSGRDGEAVAIDCDDAGPGDYRITDKVGESSDCSDQRQPVVKTDGVVYCLAAYGD